MRRFVQNSWRSLGIRCLLIENRNLRSHKLFSILAKVAYASAASSSAVSPRTCAQFRPQHARNVVRNVRAIWCGFIARNLCGIHCTQFRAKRARNLGRKLHAIPSETHCTHGLLSDS